MRELRDGFKEQLAVMGKPYFNDDGEFAFAMHTSEGMAAMEGLRCPTEIIDLIKA